MNHIVKWVGVFLYYSFFRFLPASTFPVFGRLFEKMRRPICKMVFRKMGRNVNVEKGARFGKGFDIEIGDHSSIGKDAKIPPDIKIGKDVMMGNNVTIFGTSHVFDRTDVSIISQGSIKYPPFVIEDDVWIGQGTIILPKVGKLAKGTIVGAGSVVTKSFPEYSIIAGNPAKLIRLRKE